MDIKGTKQLKPLIKIALIKKYIISLIIIIAAIVSFLIYVGHKSAIASYEKDILNKLDQQELHYDANGPFILVDVNTGISGVYNGKYRIANTVLDESVLSILEVNSSKEIPYVIVSIKE